LSSSGTLLALDSAEDTGATPIPWLSKQQPVVASPETDVGGTRIDGTIEYTFRILGRSLGSTTSVLDPS
jgi:hypothetical protein